MARNAILGGAIMMALVLALGSWWASAKQAKGFIHLCTSGQLHARPLIKPDHAIGPKTVQIDAPSGTQYWIGAAATPLAQCENVELRMDAADITAIHLVSPTLLKEHNDWLHLRGSLNEGEMSINTVSGKEQFDERPRHASRVPAPFEENLISGLTASTYGAEERTRITSAGSKPIIVTCSAGAKPAGIVLRTPWFLPQADMQLNFEATGYGVFNVNLIDQRAAQQESAYLIGSFDAASGESISLMVPAIGFDRHEWQAISFSCPATRAQLALKSIRLIPRMRPAPERATWVWEGSEWKSHPGAVFQHAARYNVQTLYISVPMVNGVISDPDALSTFIRMASQNGRQVWAVDGDPHMVLPSEHAATVARIAAYVDYNRLLDPAARLGGVQMDIEPYLMDEYAAAPDAWDAQYLALTRLLHKAAKGMPLEMAVPFWWGSKTQLLKDLAPFVTGLNVMDYRTRADEIYRFAVPFLDWGEMYNRQVRIALEAGPIDAETRWSYARAPKGEAWLVPFNDMALLLQLRKRERNPHGPAFTLAGTIADDSGATTFHKNPAQMIAMLPQLEKQFSAWDAFAGMALHELGR